MFSLLLIVAAMASLVMVALATAARGVGKALHRETARGPPHGLATPPLRPRRRVDHRRLTSSNY